MFLDLFAITPNPRNPSPKPVGLLLFAVTGLLLQLYSFGISQDVQN